MTPDEERARRREQYSPEKARAKNLRARGLTVDDYRFMMLMQGGRCAGCGAVAARLPRPLQVDHDHACCPDGKKSCGACTRGLLCDNCNRALGMVADDAHVLRSLIHYLDA